MSFGEYDKWIKGVQDSRKWRVDKWGDIFIYGDARTSTAIYYGGIVPDYSRFQIETFTDSVDTRAYFKLCVDTVLEVL